VAVEGRDSGSVSLGRGMVCGDERELFRRVSVGRTLGGRTNSIQLLEVDEGGEVESLGYCQRWKGVVEVGRWPRGRLVGRVGSCDCLEG